jgi:hypothetical protein
MLAFGTLLEKQMHAAAARRAAPCPSTISWRKQKKTSKRGTVFLYITLYTHKRMGYTASTVNFQRTTPIRFHVFQKCVET